MPFIMKDQKTLQNGQQVFDHYTAEDHEVWKILVERQLPNLQAHASKEYLRCLDILRFGNGKIPNFRKMEEALSWRTGWALHGVEEIVDIEPFLRLMVLKHFPATTWIRGRHQIDYLEEPDMFHDVFGHVPLLADEHFSGFLKALGVLGRQFMHEPKALLMVQRMYWFTVEFGLIDEDEVKAYGAGVISSPGELAHFQTETAVKRSFSVKEISETDFRTDIIQPLYFVIDSLEQLYQSVDEFRVLLEKNFVPNIKRA